MLLKPAHFKVSKIIKNRVSIKSALGVVSTRWLQYAYGTSKVFVKPHTF